MISNLSRAAALIAAFALAAPAAAQDTSANRVAADTDWSVFVEDDPQECWGVSAPKQEEFFRDGSPVSASTGEALLFVFYRPGAGVRGQVTYTGGYPFAGGSTVTLDIGGSEYELFTEGEWAWPATPEDDATIVAAMKRGAEAKLTGRSGRGTTVAHTFSLLGFTAAVEEAEGRCSD
ncbi:MAG: Invasion associated locus B (IalB) protein [Rhodobacteraceae bacterium HLUCCA08]|nr:MAG: Invasion associated locus B (IalB) protein [Rhodobacteraceae bacterium HLUCCA08]